MATSPTNTLKPVTLKLLADPVKGMLPGAVEFGGLVLPTGTVPRVVAPIGLLPPAPGVGVGVAETGAGEPAARMIFGVPLEPGVAAPAVEKAT